MVKEEEIITEAGGRGYMDMLGAEDYLLCLSPSSYFSPAGVSTSTSVTPVATTCASYLPPPYHHILSFNGQEHHGDLVGFPYGGDHFCPVVFPQKSSPTTDQCSSSVSSMPSSPTATISSSKPQTKKKGRGGDQKRTAAAASAAAKRPRVSASTTTTTTIGTTKVRRERLGERIVALQQLVSPFGKSDTASVLHEALGYIRFLHDQVQVLSSPYMQRLPSSPHLPQQESPAGVVVEPPRPGDLRSRGLCLVPVSCTEHVAGGGNSGNGADLWSAAAATAEKNNANANANANAE